MPARNMKFSILCLLILVTLFPTTASRGQAPTENAQAAQREVAQPSPAGDELEPVAVPEPSELALQFYRTGNWLWVLNVAWAVLLPGVLAFSGFSARLRNLAARLGRSWFVTIGLYVVMYLAIVFVLELPLAYYEGYVRLHDYGLSNQTLLKWFSDSVTSLAISMAAGFALAWVPYLLLTRSPRRWWIYTTALSVPFLFLVTLITPIWIAPLFNKFGPMKDGALEQKILALAGQAGIAGSRVFEVEKSVDTKAVNAYVTGVFGTKRIVLWDTLIAKLDEKELLVVMGHEMGHYVLGHVARSILLSSVITLLGLFLVDWSGRRLVARYASRLGFDRLSDVASLPLVLMLLEVAFLLLSPVALAYSRQQEHEADQFALDMTRSNHSGARAFVKLQEENLSNPRPGPIFKFFRSSHPSIGDRIDFCNSYHPWISKPIQPSKQENSTMARPDSSEHAPAYEKYISLVPEEDILETMRSALSQPLSFLANVPESEACVCHPPFTWTIKQVVGHLIDCERVFGYRALRFARGDSTPLPSFDENAYANAAHHDRIPLGDLVAEFANLRRSHVAFFEHLPKDAWHRHGTANNAAMSVRALAYALVGHERHHAAILRKRLSKVNCS